MAYEFKHTDRVTFLDYLYRHREWGYHTFGSPFDGRGPLGPRDHIKKEMKEIYEDPTDLKEWIDVIILSIDGMLRSGAPLEFIPMLLSDAYLHGDVKYPKKTIREVETAIDTVSDEPEHHAFWAGMVASAVGGYVGAGGKMTELLDMFFAKQEKNSLRNWPEWRGSDPTKAIEHVRGHHD